MLGFINHHIGVDITYHGVIHGFWSGRIMGTASIEANMIQHITSMRDEVLYEIFLDLWKVYYALDWYRYM